MPGSTQRRLRASAIAAYQQQFVPSWNRLETYLRDRYKPRARPQIGLGSAPNGAAAYAQLVRYFTTTKMSPAEIHDLGLKEVDRIEREMRAIAAEYGFSGTIPEFERELANRPGGKFESEAEMLGYAEDVLASLRPVMPTLFLREPRAQVRVRPIPPDRAASTASSYTPGTADGSRPAFFNMNTYRPAQQAKYTIEALVLHETVPGHHLQVGLARELEGVPAFRTAFRSTAFSEGWGLYAESLGRTLGTVYRDAPTRFGQLASERFRAVRLVVDTGIHARGWTRERARDLLPAERPQPVAGRGRSLHRQSRPGARLQDRRAEDPGAAAPRRAGARRPLRHPRLPRRRAAKRRPAARHARGAGRGVHQRRAGPLTMLEVGRTAPGIKSKIYTKSK